MCVCACMQLCCAPPCAEQSFQADRHARLLVLALNRRLTPGGSVIMLPLQEDESLFTSHGDTRGSRPRQPSECVGTFPACIGISTRESQVCSSCSVLGRRV